MVLTVAASNVAIASEVSADVDRLSVVGVGKLNTTGTSRCLALSEDEIMALGRVVLAGDNLHVAASIGEATIVV